MKKILVIIATAAAMLMVSCSSKESSITVGGSSELDSLSYALGSNIAYMLKYNLGDLDVNYDKVQKGIEDFARGKNSFEPEQAGEILQAYFMAPRDSVPFRSEAPRDSISYALGVDQGNGLESARVPVQTKWMATAMKDVKAGTSVFGEGQDAERTTMRIMQQWFMVDAPKAFLKESEDFLANIEKDKKWQKTESGLLYQIVEEGDAEVRAVNVTDKVKVHYKGLNMEGQQFDSSYDRGEPAEFPLNAVIKGWSEGVMLIGQGGKIKMWLHPDLAYGPQAMSAEIGPNAALYFEVELLEVMPDNQTARIGMAMVNQKLHRYNESLEELNRLIVDYPKDTSLLKARAELELEMNTPELALLDLETAVRIAPNDTELYVMCGEIYLSLGRKREAYTAFEKAVEMGVPRSQLHEQMKKARSK